MITEKSTNSKKVAEALSLRLGRTLPEAMHWIQCITGVICELLQEGKTVDLPGLGIFGVKKQLEQIIANPSTGQRFLLPPKLVILFKSDASQVNVGKDSLTITGLSYLLSQRLSDEHEQAERVLRTFLDVVRGLLNQEHVVDVKGLGCFKQSGANLLFIPDAGMRETVNKPFAHFDAVLLGEAVHFDDMPEDNTFSPEKEEPANASSEEDVPTTHVAAPSTRFPWGLLTVVLFLGILIGGILSWLLLGKEPAYAAEDKRLCMETPSLVSDSASTPEEKTQAIVAPILSDTIRYRIAGTKLTHILRKGESLALLAGQYYGNRKLWTYIARHNRKSIPDIDHIPVGTAVLIPELKVMEE